MWVRSGDALMEHACEAISGDLVQRRFYCHTPDFYVPTWKAMVEIKAMEPGAHVYDIGC